MGISEKILAYLSIYRKENKYRLASALKVGADEVTKALSALEKEGIIKVKGGRAIFVKGEKPITTKVKKRKKQPKVKKEEQEIRDFSTSKSNDFEEPEEEKSEVEPGKEQPEEIPSKEQVEQPEEIGKVEEAPSEEKVEGEQPTEIPTEEVEKEEPSEERIEGTVKFYDPNKGFGFIIGDDGKEYYVHKSGLKDGILIEVDDKISFKVVQGDKGPKAEEVEWISQA